MSWEKKGTVTVTKGSKLVTGDGTGWAAPGVLQGHIFLGPDGEIYEIETLNTGSQLTLASPYSGPTAASQAYAVCPSRGIQLELYERILELIKQSNDLKNGLAGRVTAAVAEAKKKTDDLITDSRTLMRCKQHFSGHLIYGYDDSGVTKYKNYWVRLIPHKTEVSDYAVLKITSRGDLNYPNLSCHAILDWSTYNNQSASVSCHAYAGYRRINIYFHTDGAIWLRRSGLWSGAFNIWYEEGNAQDFSISEHKHNDAAVPDIVNTDHANVSIGNPYNRRIPL